MREVKYVWKEDLKNRITEAMKEATSREDFVNRLAANGVIAIYKNAEKHEDYISYELKDRSNFASDDDMPKNETGEYRPLKVNSIHLGTDFDLEELDHHISANH